MANTTNNFTNPFNLPPVVQIVLPLSVARNLLTLLEECESTWSVDPKIVTNIRREYTSEMIRHGIIRPSEVSVMTPDEDHSHEDATQGEYDADNAWLRSAGWGEM
jgi:hypothetical protein